MKSSHHQNLAIQTQYRPNITRTLNDTTKVNDVKLKWGRFSLAIRKKSFTVQVMSTLTGCQEMMWIPCHWKSSRPGWMGLWATLSSAMCLCQWQRDWKDMILKVHFNLCFYMIKWYYLPVASLLGKFFGFILQLFQLQLLQLKHMKIFEITLN